MTDIATSYTIKSIITAIRVYSLAYIWSYFRQCVLAARELNARSPRPPTGSSGGRSRRVPGGAQSSVHDTTTSDSSAERTQHANICTIVYDRPAKSSKQKSSKQATQAKKQSAKKKWPGCGYLHVHRVNVQSSAKDFLPAIPPTFTYGTLYSHKPRSGKTFSDTTKRGQQ